MENFGKNNKLSLFKSKQSDAENVFGKSTKNTDFKSELFLCFRKAVGLLAPWAGHLNLDNTIWFFSSLQAPITVWRYLW